MISDIREFLWNGDEYKTNQTGIGIKQLFRDYIIKVWKGINFQSNNYCKCNQEVIKVCVKYYYNC